METTPGGFLRIATSGRRQRRSLMFVTYTMLALYALPLFVIAIVAFATEGFSRSTLGLDFTISIAGVFMSPTRDALGTFVVPFIMAYSVTTVRRGSGMEHEALQLFVLLVALFLLSLCTHCIVDMRLDQLIHQLKTDDQDRLHEIRQNLPALTQAYIKETLAYVSLILGISRTDRVASETPS